MELLTKMVWVIGLLYNCLFFFCYSEFPQLVLKLFTLCRSGSVVAYFVLYLESVTLDQSDAAVALLKAQVDSGTFGGEPASSFNTGNLHGNF